MLEQTVNKWINENIDSSTVNVLVNHINSFGFTSNELAEKWNFSTSEEIINQYYLKKIAMLFGYTESIKNKSILELGPGVGITSYLYYVCGAASYHGVEKYEPNVDVSRKLCTMDNWTFTHGMFEEYLKNILPGQYDTVSLINVLTYMDMDFMDNFWKFAYQNFNYMIISIYGRRSMTSDYTKSHLGSIGSQSYYRQAMLNAGWKILFTTQIPKEIDCLNHSARVCTKFFTRL